MEANLRHLIITDALTLS